MIVAYCRVSTARQKADSQVAEISRRLKANGCDEHEVTWYIDKESGKTLRRPEFERLQADIFSGRMIAAVMLGLAEIELEYRQQRQMAGVEVAKKNGIYKGRKPGTTKAKPTLAHVLRDQGLKITEIVNALGTSTRTVQRYLRTT